MKLPRDISGKELIKSLESLGYSVTRQKGSHVYLVAKHQDEHHIAIPLHNPLKLGTLMGILNDVAAHLKIPRNELTQRLFG
ncbi:MAG: type II toxin-antitoxin system HicA family toxin [Ignavibacteriota bacterium]